jgi:hypothetical protein
MTRRRLVDTNLIVRHLTQDHSEHSRTADELFRACDNGTLKLIILPVVLPECVFVLESFYKHGRERISAALVTGMLCGILSHMLKACGAPKSGLASILGVHPTRLAAILDRKRWPADCRPARTYFRNATLWMFLGKRWDEIRRTFLVKDRRTGTVKTDFPHLSEGQPEWNTLWVHRYAEQLVGYFFRLPGDQRQPYFSPNRRDWTAPYDRTELGDAIRWTMRQVELYHRKGYIAFFVPTSESAATLFDSDGLRPIVAYAAHALPEYLRVEVYRPHGTDREDVAGFALIENRMKQDAEAEASRELPRRGASGSKETGEVKWHGGDVAVEPTMLYQSVLSFMYLGYTRKEEGLDQFQEHVCMLRPFSREVEAETPFAIEMTANERDKLVRDAKRSCSSFMESLAWLNDDDFVQSALEDPP